MPYKHKRTGETRAEMPPAYRVKFNGKICTKCNKPLIRGEVHQWDKTRKGVDYHQDCEDTRNSPWEYVASESSGEHNDCAVRAVAVAAALPYESVHELYRKHG